MNESSTIQALKISVAVALMCASATFAVESELVSLRLFPQGGEATRQVNTGPLNDSLTVEITGLPRSGQESGLIVELVGESSGWVAAYRLENLSAEELPVSKALQQLEANKREVEQSIEDLKSTVQTLDRKLAVLERMRKALLDGISEGHGDFQAAAWETLGQEQELLADKLRAEREMRVEMEALQRQLERLNVRIREQREKDESLNRKLVVQLGGVQAGEAVELSFTLPFRDGSWSPVYRMDARPQDKSWELVYAANVANNTGEDWAEVPLQLMTRRQTGQLQAQDPWPVYLENPERRQEDQVVYSRPAVPAEMMADESLRMRAKAAPPAPEIERLTTQFSVKLGSPASVPAMESRRLEIQRISGEVDFWTAVTPMMDTTGYLHGEGTLPLELPLLGGELTLSVDGSAVGRSFMEFVEPGQAMEVGFGPNPAIEIEYKTLQQKGQDKGIFDKQRRYQREYQTTLTNRMPMAHEVRVHERVPVSRDERIVVELQHPDDLEVDPEDGMFVRILELSEGEETVLPTRFEVSAPRDWILPENF